MNRIVKSEHILLSNILAGRISLYNYKVMFGWELLFSSFCPARFVMAFFMFVWPVYLFLEVGRVEKVGMEERAQGTVTGADTLSYFSLSPFL